MLTPFALALRTLTIIPFFGRHEISRTEDFRLSLVFFPMIGVLIAALIYSLNWLFCLTILPEIARGFVLVIASVFLTGALHIDGLADVSDGFFGGRTKERILEILKDSSHGTFGVIAIVLDLMAKVWFYGFILGHDGIMLIAASFVISRSMQSLVLAYVPSAAAGTASSFTGTSHRIIITVSAIIALGAAVFIPYGVISGCFSLVACAIFIFVCIRKIGGITGDCVGAVNEIAEIAVLAAGSIMI
jgi:adenosylcobinamide-GDP ribazoletransferase